MQKLTREQAENLTPVSEGTLRTRDLMTAFTFALEEAATADGKINSLLLDGLNDARAMFDDECRAFAWRALGWDAGREVGDGDLRDLRDAAETYLADLTLLLEELAPEGMYFGAHPGDGACFGFWLDEEEAEA